MDDEEGNRGRGEEASVVALSGRRASERRSARAHSTRATRGSIRSASASPACPANPARARLSACAPGRNPNGRRVGGIRKSYATSGRTDGQTDEPTAERASNRAPTTHNAGAGSVVVASCRHHRSPHRRREYCCLHCRRHAESPLRGLLDANVGGRKVVKGCSSMPCPPRCLDTSCPPSFFPSILRSISSLGAAWQCHGARGAAVAGGRNNA